MRISKITASALALLTLAGLVIRIYLHQESGKSLLEAFSFLYQFFTIWSNTLVFIVFALFACGRAPHRLVILMSTVAIMGVGIIFHTLLSSPANQQGLDLLANLITHTFIPILTFLWWAGFQSQHYFAWQDAIAGIFFPAIYCVYALVRAEYSGFYPYPFIDLEKLGAAGLIKSIFIISLAFLILGLCLVTISKLRNR
ncbi:MAG: Pr6Pr family membrane protein [Gammaproteobacteria bacterium]|nr:Pr6Pr family membrane protein [Gammaproteobacteria bacterium]